MREAEVNEMGPCGVAIAGDVANATPVRELAERLLCVGVPAPDGPLHFEPERDGLRLVHAPEVRNPRRLLRRARLAEPVDAKAKRPEELHDLELLGLLERVH